MNIGDWIQRERRGKAHKVESIVAGDIVTKCGRRMTDEPTKSGGKLVQDTRQSDVCSVCWRV